MIIKIQYSKQATKFLNKNKSVLSENKVKQLIISALKKLLEKEVVNIDLKKLKGNYSNYYRIRVGNIRIIFEFVNNEIVIVFVVSVGYRGDIYKT